MRKLQQLARVVGVEITDGLKEVNREKDVRGNWRTLVRLLVSFETDDELTDSQKAVFAKLSDAQKAMIRRNKRAFNVSNLFNASDLLDTSFDTPEGGFTDEQQDAICEKVKTFITSLGNVNLFTAHTFSVAELTNNEFSVVYDSENETPVRERSYLSFGFYDDDERVKSVLSAQLKKQIDEGDVLTSIQTPESATDNAETLLF